MNEKEIAMRLTQKAMEMNLIPISQLADNDNPEKIDVVRSFNAEQIVKFYKQILTDLGSN